jgi:hypothetical protein
LIRLLEYHIYLLWKIIIRQIYGKQNLIAFGNTLLPSLSGLLFSF